LKANPPTPGHSRQVSRLPPEIVQKVPLPTYRFTIKPDELGVWIDVLAISTAHGADRQGQDRGDRP
jgi:hypothetical protein